MNFADYVRDQDREGCRFGMPVAIVGFDQDRDGAALPIARPLRTIDQAREDIARARFFQTYLGATHA